MLPLTFPLRSTFLALPLAGAARRRFAMLQERLRPFAPCLRFQRSDTPHLTLAFWPSVGALEWKGIVAQASRIAEALHPFSLNTTKVNTFGVHGQDGVLFLDVDFSPALADAKKRCPWRGEKPWHPHITLAYIAHPQRFARVKKEVWKVLRECTFPIRVDRLRLYATIGGKSQTSLRDFPFGA